MISQRLIADVGDSLDPDVGPEVRGYLIRDSLETKLLSHPSFQPLKRLITMTLESHGIQFDDISYWPTPFQALAVLDGKRPNIRAGATNVLHAGRTLIRWISVSDQGRAHKCKEFCGKAWGLRILVDMQTGAPIPREDVSKCLLVVDGTFSDDDLGALARAGWDEIFYPDEMAELAAAIV